MLKYKLITILSEIFTLEQHYTLGLISSLNNNLNLEQFEATFLNKLNTNIKNITLILDNQELFIILDIVKNSCINKKLHYNTYNLSLKGSNKVKSFKNKKTTVKNSHLGINYTLYDDDNGWDYAYFWSGGEGGAYTTNDLGKKTTEVDNNSPNGADPSCGGKDSATMKECLNKIKRYDTPLNLAIKNGCSYKDGAISLVNEDNAGKVAVITRPFGLNFNAQSKCTSGHYVNDNTTFDDYKNKLAYLLLNCGKNEYTFLYKNTTTSTENCLIKTKAFTDANINLPEDDREIPHTNDGIAISWGHGLGKGACGAMALVQQGPGNDNTSGNTVLNFQVGMRAWSGEMSDVSSGQATYLMEGRNNDQCLQPRFKELTQNDIKSLFEVLCSDNSCPAPTPAPTGDKYQCDTATKTCNTTTDPNGITKELCESICVAQTPSPSPSAK